MLDPASIAAGAIVFGGLVLLVCGYFLSQQAIRIACLEADNMDLARKLTRILAPLERANHRRKLKAQIRRAEERAIQAMRHDEMRETLGMVG